MKENENKRIMLVHSDPFILFWLKSALEKQGHQVLAAHNGEQGLKLIRQIRPDLISMELGLPKRSGIMLCHELRKNKKWAGIPCMIMYGEPNGNGKKAGNADIFAGKTVCGPTVYLEQPTRLDDYLELIGRALGAPDAGKPLPSHADQRCERVAELILEAEADVVMQVEHLLTSQRPRLSACSEC